MRFLVILYLVLCTARQFANGLSEEEMAEVTESCCSYGQSFAMTLTGRGECASGEAPEEVEPDNVALCLASLRSCCEEYFNLKSDCSDGMKYAAAKRCSVPRTDTGKTCCEECSIGILTGESHGREACGSVDNEYVSPSTALRKNAYHQCCVEAAERTTTEPPTTTTRKPETTTMARERCKPNSCDQECNDETGRIDCSCRYGYRLQPDKRSCKDINECAESQDDVCTEEGTVCHNIPGSFKCVPLSVRENTITCPAGFKRNVVNQVCDDINECQSSRPPCPKYLCENTIGGFKCGGKPGKPYEEETPRATPPTASGPPEPPKNDICPPGFRSGVNDECDDIDECQERSDDCQRLSQHCINTHGGFFCQDHVSKRCAPGFKVNRATGVCEDIDECEESLDVCQRNEVCVNMPGAYTCKSKISTLPKLGAGKTCQEGMRMRPGSSICEDIDECREGTHLCDRFQNCVNTYGAHECQCKNGFELDSSGSCIDIDECSLKLDNCREGTHCLNVLGSFTCTRRPPTTSTTTKATPAYEYEYYDSDEDNSTIDNDPNRNPVPSSPVTPRPTTPRPTTPRPTTPKPTTPRPTTQRTTTTSTTPRPTPPPYVPRPTTPRRPYNPYTPYTNRPRPTSTTQRPITQWSPFKPTTPRPEVPGRGAPRPVAPTEVSVPKPNYNPLTIEKERDPEGTYGINTGEIPKGVWTNVIGKDGEDPTTESDNERHCISGYEMNALGDCVDTNECEGNRSICSELEECENRPGGYVCNCVPGYRRDNTGWCVPHGITATTSSTTLRTPPPPPPLPPMPEHRYTPYRPRRPTEECGLGYQFDPARGRCVDIDECATNRSTCSPHEDCVNIEGGYRCECGRRCNAAREPVEVWPSYVPSSRQPTPDTNLITVGAQYGQRGPRHLRPTYTRLPSNGAIVTACPWGYKLTNDKMCLDIDECERNSSECGPQQRCENFYGGYSCQCPAGHKLAGQDGCEDIDECQFGTPCPHNAECINTVGSYRCACGSGFRNAPSNEKVCVDIDECSETPQICEQGCANAWGGYRCYCQRGYRLNSDNRTCADVDECAESLISRSRGRLCGGACVNEAGSYRCACPTGYRLAQDQRSCIDIDECETGEASCARSSNGEVCQNTRGGYHCHHIQCPRGYQLEAKHRCSRVQRMCPISDWDCLRQPTSYSYNFITFVANIFLPDGSADLFTMHGPTWAASMVTFEIRMISVEASSGVKPLELSCFEMRQSGNVCVVSLLCSPAGPQVAELELTMTLRRQHEFAGSAVARLVVIVSQYEF